MSSFPTLHSHICFVLLSSIFFLSCKKDLGGEVALVEKNSDKGFNYPYYLFIPDDLSAEQEKYLVVEPNNSGVVTDDFQEHIDRAKSNASRDYFLGNYTARKLGYPLLVPVFPRAKSTSQMYTHSLDRDVMLQKENELERIDLQLLAMVEDAKVRLQQKGISIAPEFLLTGFSASGSFVNRFTLIHPNAVKAVAAGGVNSILMLPFSEEKEQLLTYPAGTKDYSQIFGKSFDSIAFKNTPQYYFMGEQDDNDALPYSDAFDESERRAIEIVLGKEMMPGRWQTAKELYYREGVKAEIKTYGEIGHEHPEQVKQEIVAFFENAIRNTNF
jgi:predicted esterase